MYPLETKRHEKTKMAILPEEHATKRLPAIVDGAVWKEVTKGRLK